MVVMRLIVGIHDNIFVIVSTLGINRYHKRKKTHGRDTLLLHNILFLPLNHSFCSI